MKTIEIKNIILLLACTALAACEADPVESESGTLPDKEALETVSGKLRCGAFPGQEVNVMLTEGDGSVMSNFYFQQTASATDGISLNVQVGSPDGERQMLPESNYEFPDGKNLELSQGHVRSDIKRIKFIASGLTPGEYVLPLTLDEPRASNDVLYYNLKIRQPQLTDFELHVGEDLFFIYYVNTTQYSPLLVQDYIFNCTDYKNTFWHSSTGNIVNLRIVTLDYEAATGRALLNLGSDMSYVLDNAVKYIWPLQEQGRKVCISIEGGGKGLGFCNLTDEQRVDFVAQVKTVVEKYGIDGVNLWDRNSGYGTDGMPNTNTTSYPKLIKALREALGTEKLLTVTVYDKPTETFYDTEACGGIAVGDYIDYAWSGYNSDTETPQLLDPWHPDLEYVSEYTQKPIAHLDPSKFGCYNAPIYNNKSLSDPATMQDPMFLLDWVDNNYKPNNIIVFADLRTNLQDNYEGWWDSMFSMNCDYLCPDTWIHDPTWKVRKTYAFELEHLSEVSPGNNGYGKWLKDW